MRIEADPFFVIWHTNDIEYGLPGSVILISIFVVLLIAGFVHIHYEVKHRENDDDY